MEKESINTTNLIEARKDAEWIKKVKNAKTMDEYIKLFGEKGIEIPAAEMDKIATFITNNKAGELSDEELDQATGGIFSIKLEIPIPLIDDCIQSFASNICVEHYLHHKRCPHCISKGTRSSLGWVCEYFDCQKGYFKDMSMVLYPYE